MRARFAKQFLPPVVPQANRKQPLERRITRTHTERGAHSSSTQAISDSRPCCRAQG